LDSEPCYTLFTKGMERLFAYGTLQDPIIQKEILGRNLVGETGVLPGYEKVEILQEHFLYPNVVPREGGAVCGRIYTVTVEELASIDVYEGAPYKRFLAPLATGERVWIYAAYL
jgi:gamma-glutamylcyclotransferase (GGCT)/AIG2-like uncharacterized protein YtfP